MIAKFYKKGFFGLSKILLLSDLQKLNIVGYCTTQYQWSKECQVIDN